MDTKKYLKNVIDLEKTLYTLNKSIGYLMYSKENLGIKNNYEEPIYNSGQEIDAAGVRFGTTVMTFFVGGILGIIIGLIKNSFFAFCICVAVVGIVSNLYMRSLRKSSNKELRMEYENKKVEYEQALKQDEKRVAKELEKKRNIGLQISALQNKYAATSAILQRLYGLNVLYPKYRNLVAVATFYEYFDSGRCKDLTGHEGAYNIYENEIRLNTILGKLDDIIEHLEDIRSNQYIIYHAIKEGDKIANNIYQKSVKISESMNAIEDNTELIAYNSSITAKNTEILKFISIYDHMR